MFDFSFALKVTGLSRVRALVDKTVASTALLLGSKRMEDYLLKSVEDRFEPRGSNDLAQRAPDGSLWRMPEPITVATRKSNRNAIQALVDTGTLQSSFITTRKSRSVFGVSVPTTLTVTVDPSSPAYKYFLFQNLGGTTPTGGAVPPREFLALSNNQIKTIQAIAAAELSRGLNK